MGSEMFIRDRVNMEKEIPTIGKSQDKKTEDKGEKV